MHAYSSFPVRAIALGAVLAAVAAPSSAAAADVFAGVVAAHAAGTAGVDVVAGGAAVATGSAGLAAGAAAIDLPQLVERAWSLSRDESIDSARGSVLDARAVATAAPFAGAPTLGLDLRRDQPRWAGLPGTDASATRGRNEIDVGVSVPVWLPGQRDAERRVLERDRAALAADVRLRRLALAQAVREAVWTLALARAEQRVQQAREQSAQRLEADVARRIAAGDLAPSDGMLARAERLAASAALREAAAAVDASRVALAALTGEREAGRIAEQPADAVDPDAHASLAAARETVDAARARFEQVRATRRDNPTLAVSARFDRDAWGVGYRNTVQVGVSLPLDTEARNAPRLAAASAELARAEVELERERRRRAAELERARLAFDAAREALALQAERSTAASAAQTAIERAFRAGERGLPELLRLRAQTLEAELARDAAQERVGQAIARLNHAMGILP